MPDQGMDQINQRKKKQMKLIFKGYKFALNIFYYEFCTASL